MESVNTLLRALRGRWPAPKPAPFNLSRWLAPGERGINRLLADLFDPAGSHGMGDAFLRPLLLRIGHPAATANEWLGVATRVDAPVICANGAVRMVDIQIDMAGYQPVLLENKPWAAEQDRQLEDYWQFALRHDGWLVFLPAFPNRRPSSLEVNTEAELRKNDRFVVLAYADQSGTHEGPSRLGLVSLLKEAATTTKADHLAWAMDDILQYLRREVLGEREDEMEDARWLADNLSHEDYATAQRLASAWPHMRGVYLGANLTCLAQSAVAQAKTAGLSLRVQFNGKGAKGSDWTDLRSGLVRPPGELVYFMDFTVDATTPLTTIRLEYSDPQWSGAKLSWQNPPGQVIADGGVAQLLQPQGPDWLVMAGGSDTGYAVLTPQRDAFCAPTSPTLWNELAKSIVEALRTIISKTAAKRS